MRYLSAPFFVNNTGYIIPRLNISELQTGAYFLSLHQ